MTLTPEQIAYRATVLPYAIESVIDSMERSRRIALEFAVDYESARTVEAVLHERFLNLLHHALDSTSVDELEERLHQETIEAQKLVAADVAQRRDEAAQIATESLVAIADLVPTTEAQANLLRGYKALMAEIPDLAAAAPDDVTFELLFEEACIRLGCPELLETDVSDQ